MRKRKNFGLDEFGFCVYKENENNRRMFANSEGKYERIYIIIAMPERTPILYTYVQRGNATVFRL